MVCIYSLVCFFLKTTLLRWLETVSSTFQDLQFDGSFYFIHTEISHQISLCEKAFRILLPPIREAKRVSHT